MRLNKEQLLAALSGATYVIGIGIGYALATNKHKRIAKEQLDAKDREFAVKTRELLAKYGNSESVVEQLETTSVQLAFELEENRRIHNQQTQEANLVIKKFTETIQKLDNVLDQLQDTGEVYLGRFTKEESDDNGINRGTIMRILDSADEEPVVRVFTNGDDDWSYEEELAKRTPEVAYTIHRDEFFEDNDLPHSHTTITYYRGDNILCDELDAPIYDPERVVGKLEFGRGSQDPNVVYVRNERLAADYEVVLDPGYYQVEVLGQAVEDVLKAPDMKHSVQKFRME